MGPAFIVIQPAVFFPPKHYVIMFYNAQISFTHRRVPHAATPSVLTLCQAKPLAQVDIFPQKKRKESFASSFSPDSCIDFSHLL